MKTYETVLILHDRKNEDGGERLLTEFTQTVQAMGGQLLARKGMGRRQLTSPIKRQTTAYYWDVAVQLPADKVAALKDAYHLNEGVLRMEVFEWDRPEAPGAPSSSPSVSSGAAE